MYGILRWRRLRGVVLLFALAAAGPNGSADTARERAQMLEDIRRSVKESAGYTGREELSERTMAAMAAVPREAFVPADQKPMAYLNRPLPIGRGQTISQPLIVALMTDLLDPEPGDVVLEVGTGSGYQAAVLGQLVKQVYTIEVIPELASGARAAIETLGYDNITVRAGDGYAGWPEHAPFDGIIVTAAPDEIPPPLIEQLTTGGKLVIPVGPVHGFQQLMLVEKDAGGKLRERAILPVAFVPLTGDR